MAQTIVRATRLLRHSVGGGFRESVAGGVFESLNPASGEVVAEGRAVAVDVAVAAARGAFEVIHVALGNHPIPEIGAD